MTTPDGILAFWIARSRHLDGLFVSAWDRLESAYQVLDVFADQVPQILSDLSGHLSAELLYSIPIGYNISNSRDPTIRSIYRTQIQPKTAMLRSLRAKVAGVRATMLNHQAIGKAYDVAATLKQITDLVNGYVIPLAPA